MGWLWESVVVASREVIGIDVGEFDQVDRTDDADAFVRWMEQQRRLGPELLVERLALDDSSVVLDVGCGPGVDLRELGSRSGLAVGIDRSTSMVGAARNRVDGLSAYAFVGDAATLPFSSASFDACMARAVLVHSPQPKVAVGEIARVLKPGAKVVLSEPDHGSHLVAGADHDVFERIKAHRRTMFQNPLVGRQLPDLAVRAGLHVERSWAFPIVHRRLDDARAGGGPFDKAVQSAVEAGTITSAEAASYFDTLTELDERGAFFFAAMAIAVEASLPANP